MNITVKEIDASAHEQFMDHEKVFRLEGDINGQKIIAFSGVHNTVLGPALGGIRYKAYDNEEAALGDALRLSEAMTWKNSAVGLHHGGGKSVIMAPAGMERPSDDVLAWFADGLNEINKNGALYFGAQDMNISEEAIDFMGARSEWIRGRTSFDLHKVGGTPSPLTAMAVVECIKVAAEYKLGKHSLKAVTISMQGLGTVGGEMAWLLAQEGAVLKGCDPDMNAFAHLAAKGVNIERVDMDDIFDVPADIFAPNAVGGILTAENIERLEQAGVQIICGAANNQQADQVGGAESRILHEKGILYSPDYIVNAGGVFWVAEEGKDAQTARDYIKTQVARAFKDVLEMADQNPDKDMAALARELAESRIKNKG